MSPRRKGSAAPLLTAEQLAALLSEYVANEVPITALVRRWGVSAAYINRARRAAGLSGRAVVNRFETLKVVDVEAHMLPVFPVRLVGRAVLERLNIACSRGCPPGGPCAHWPEPCPAAEEVSDARRTKGGGTDVR